MKVKQMQRILKEAGYIPRPSKSDHIIYKKDGVERNQVLVVGRKDMNKMICKRILKEIREDTGYRLS